ncbi:uncharacterized protein LOC125660714 isoform X8 [Ostrea edulis]|uniref:uncharacterized protein LOC125660714 isoform X8 n=1 Tax=Ostrea edulis TaxID=37623 RepID=UPI002094E32E|nr:uncharacterized protein LOC125660714 isoform X8 [Ostrea edulis]
MSNVNRALDCTITRKEPDSDSCMIFLSGTPILQVGNCCTVVEIKVNDDLVQWLENATDDSPAEREKGIYTLLCLDGSDVSKDPGLRKTLRQLYKKILEDLDKTHCDQCVTFNEFVSLIAFGGNGKVHIEQPFQIEFPQEDAFDHVIDEVVGCDLPLDASQMLTTVFQIASKHGQRFQKEGYVIQPRIVIFTNGKFKEPESTALPVSSCDTMYPVTFVPIDQNCDKGVLKRIISNIGGEITTDIPYIARYAGHLQMFVDALKMGKRDINEILETIKEYAPDDVKDMANIFKVYKISVPVEKTQRSQTDTAGPEAFII